MIPIMGFCQLALFGGYAIYFPELFPTRLRSTGTSFCYNGARFVAAASLFAQGPMIGYFKTLHGGDGLQAARTGGMVMCLIFLVGLLALPFAGNEGPAAAGVIVVVTPRETLKEKPVPFSTPDWLTLHGCELKDSTDGRSATVYMDGRPRYLLIPVPAGGKYGCRVAQTENGKRLDAGATFGTSDEALRGGLEDLRKALGW